MVALFRKTFLSKRNLGTIAQAISDAEQRSRGEIRVSVRHRRAWRDRRLNLRDIAVQEFHALGMNNTRERTGILLMIFIREHEFHIIADEGITARVDQSTWDAIAAGMRDHFQQGSFLTGILAAVGAIGTILMQHFPRKPGDADELSNRVVVD